MSQINRVLVIGASGNVGRPVVERLAASGLAVRALSRDPGKCRFPAGVEPAAGDLTVPASLDDALREVESVFLVWTAPLATIAEVITCVARRARRIVFLSSPHRTPHPFFQQPNPMAALHAAIEREIAASGMAATILRPGMFASNVVPWWAEQIRRSDVVRWPFAAAASAPIDLRDLADAAVQTITDPSHVGGDYVLTGPESLTHAEQVEIIGAVIGRKLRYEEMPPGEFRALTARQAPPAVADMLLNAWSASVGIPAYTTTEVAQITGRPARTFRAWAADHADAFR